MITLKTLKRQEPDEGRKWNTRSQNRQKACEVFLDFTRTPNQDIEIVIVKRSENILVAAGESRAYRKDKKYLKRYWGTTDVFLLLKNSMSEKTSRRDRLCLAFTRWSFALIKAMACSCYEGFLVAWCFIVYSYQALYFFEVLRRIELSLAIFWEEPRADFWFIVFMKVFFTVLLVDASRLALCQFCSFITFIPLTDTRAYSVIQLWPWRKYPRAQRPCVDGVSRSYPS